MTSSTTFQRVAYEADVEYTVEQAVGETLIVSGVAVEVESVKVKVPKRKQTRVIK